jgi:hypothetical protein
MTKIRGCLKSPLNCFLTLLFLSEKLCDPLCFNILETTKKDSKDANQEPIGLFQQPRI